MKDHREDIEVKYTEKARELFRSDLAKGRESNTVVSWVGTGPQGEEEEEEEAIE